MLHPIAPGKIWFAQQALKVGPLAIRTRMTVVRLVDGGLWVHSPIAPTPPLVQALAAVGPVRYVVAPNKGHHLFLNPFLDAFPRARGYVAEGLAAKRPDLASLDVLSSETSWLWEPELRGVFVGGLPLLNEIVWFHASTGTLIVTDMLVCFGEDNPPLTRFVARLLGVYRRLGMSPTVRLMVRDKRALARTVETLLSLPVERVVVAHDTIVDSGARDALARAFTWLRT